MNTPSTSINTEEYGQVEVLGVSTFNSPVIVEKSIVERLAKLLPLVPFHQVKNSFREKLLSTTNLDSYIILLQDELAFHKTVNQILEVTEVTKATEINYFNKEEAAAH